MANVTYGLPASGSLCCVLHLRELCAGVRVWFAGQPRPTLRRKATAVIFTSSTVILSIKARSQAPCCNSLQTSGCAAVLASSSGQVGGGGDRCPSQAKTAHVSDPEVNCGLLSFV